MIRVEREAAPPSGWEALAGEDPRATLFLHPRWMNSLLDAYPRYRPLYFVAREGETLVGVLPAVVFRRLGFRQIVSLPYGTHGGPVLARGREEEGGRALARAFRDAAGAPDVMRFEMTLYDPTPALREQVPAALGVAGRAMHAHLVDLSVGAGGLWERAYHRGARRSVEGAERAGVTVTAGRDPARVMTLARLHRGQSRSWVGIPPHPEEAIAKMTASFGEDARVYVAEREGRALAACLVLEHSGKEAVPWVSGALPEAREVSAFHLLIHVALGEAAGRGCRRWYFGGSGGNPRIEFFKESFGARAVPVLRCHRLAGWARPLRRRPAWDA